MASHPHRILASFYENMVNQEKERIKDLEKRMELKKRAIKYLGGECGKCGYEKCIQALEFNHIRGKKYKMADLFRNKSPWEKIKKEIDKCELLCANCHREKTWEYLNSPAI